MRHFAMLIAAFLIAACEITVDPDVDVEYLNSPEMEAQDFPFSQAVRVDNLLFLSGDIGWDRATAKLAEGGIAAETRQTLENIKTTLEMAGSSLDKVVKCTVFLADMAEWAAMNEVYKEYLPQKPARSALGVNGLALGARTEIECIAVIE